VRPRALAFAVALARRHRARRRSPQEVAAVLTLRRTPRPTVPAAPVGACTTLVHAPRLVLAVTALHRHEHPEARFERSTRTVRTLSNPLVERLLMRRERVERVPAPCPPAAVAPLAPAVTVLSTPAVTPPTVPPRLPTVVLRRTTIEHRGADAPADRPKTATPPAVPTVPAPVLAPPEPSGTPLAGGRLVDEVLAAIDRRIVAQRERLGRLP
jgi:hypothetical protein